MDPSKHFHTLPVSEWVEIQEKIKETITSLERQRIEEMYQCLDKAKECFGSRARLNILSELPVDTLSEKFCSYLADRVEYFRSPSRLSPIERPPYSWIKTNDPEIVRMVKSYEEGLVRLKSLEKTYLKYLSDAMVKLRKKNDEMDETIYTLEKGIEKRKRLQTWYFIIIPIISIALTIFLTK